MAKLIENSTPAERARGCVFAETFENTQAVAENGGVITGDTVINKSATFDGTGDYIDYNYVPITRDNHTITVDFDFTAGRGVTQIIAQWGDGLSTNNSGAIVIDTADGLRFSTNAGVAVYVGALTTGRHTVTVTYGGGVGNSRAAYVDGVQKTLQTTAGGAGSATAGITIGAETDNTNTFLGTIYSVKIFNNQLTLQEHTDYYNNSTYDYIDTPILDLPMGMAQHDPTNTRTLDISSSGADATLINSPTKLTKKGYALNGTNQAITAPVTGLLNEAELSFVFKFTPNFEADDATANFMFFDSTSTDRYILYRDLSQSLTLLMNGASGGIAAVATLLPLWKKGRVNTLAITTTTGKTNIWLNGYKIVDNSATVWTPVNPATLYIGTRYSAERYFDGDIHSFKVWNKLLTPMQIKDLYIRDLKQINDI
jgi:hypothetical protein